MMENVGEKGCEGCRRLASALAGGIGITSGMVVAGDDGRVLAVLAMEPFPDAVTATNFAAWLRTELTDPDRMAAFRDAVHEGGPRLQ